MELLVVGSTAFIGPHTVFEFLRAGRAPEVREGDLMGEVGWKAERGLAEMAADHWRRQKQNSEGWAG